MSLSKTYVVAWDQVLENTKNIEQQLNKANLDYLIYNVSSLEPHSDNWRRPEKSGRYYAHFINSIRDFSGTDHKIFIFHAGDAIGSNIESFTQKTEKIMSIDPGVGLIAPEQTNDPFAGKGSFISESFIYKDLNLSTHTNGIYVAMSREVADFMNNFFEWVEHKRYVNLHSLTSGWGIDTAYCAIAIFLKLKIYRDTSVIMKHPTGSAYNYGIAEAEAKLFMGLFVEYCLFKKLNADRVKWLMDTSIRKCHGRDAFSISVAELYGENYDFIY